MNPNDNESINWLGLLQVVADNLRLLVLLPVAAGLLSLAYTATFAPSYTSTTKFLPPQQQQSAAAAMLQGLGSLGGLAGAASGIKNPGEQYVTFLKSHRLQDLVIDRFKLAERFGTTHSQDTRDELSNRVQITNGLDGLIAVTVTEAQPKAAADLANGHVEALGQLLSKIAVTEAQQRRLFFEKQLLSAKDSLAKAELALQSSGISRAVLKTNPASAVDSLARLKASLTAQEIKLASMRGYLTEQAPDFKQAQVEMAAMRAQLEHAEKQEPAANASGSDYVSNYRNFKYYETLFELFSKQYEIARIDESREGASIQVLDIAEPPIKKSATKRTQTAVVTSLTVGIALLLFFFVRNALRNADSKPETAEKLARLRQALRKAMGRRAPA